MIITDTVRRRLLLTLFILTGPVILLVLGGIIGYRNSGQAASRQAMELSRQLGADVQMERIVHLRPGRMTWRHLELSDRGEPFLRIPEIRVRRQRTIPAIWGKTFFSRFSDGNPQEAEAFFQIIASSAEEGVFWEIPVLSIRASMQDRFIEFLSGLTRHLSVKGPIYWTIGRLEWLDDTVFFQTPDDAPAKFDPEPAASTDILDGSDTAIAARLDQFLSNRPFQANHLSGLLGGNANQSLLIAKADPLRMAADSALPVLLTTGIRTEGSFRRMTQFDTGGIPFPTKLAAEFLPAVKTAESGWLSGRLRWERVPDRGKLSISHFSLAQFDLSPAAGLITPQVMRGQVIRLTIDDGEINDGVFLGTGEVRLTSAAIARSFIVRAQKALRLIFNPPTALNNRFPDDAVPFDQVRFGFELTKEGVTLSSSYPTGVIGVFQSGTGEHSLFLPTEGEKTFAPYPEVLSALSDGESPYWSPFYRNAINSLPVE